MTYNYANIPATVTIENIAKDTDISIPLFKTNLYKTLKSGDKLIIKATTSSELIYFENMKTMISGISVKIETTTT